jgi:hypothetical protein
MPDEKIGWQVNSIAHHLGEHVKRTGQEAPGIAHSIIIPLNKRAAEYQAAPTDSAENTDNDLGNAGAPAAWSSDHRLAPHRMTWPSYWAIKTADEIKPLNPEVVYELIRRSLKVRREFTDELSEVKLSLTQRKELLGDERARVKDEERTEEEAAKIAKAEDEARTAQVNERMAKALADIEEAYPGSQAIYISGGTGFVRDVPQASSKNEEDDEALKIKQIDAAELGEAAAPYAWPQAHNVRPAQQSLGINGCTECHSEGAKFFGSMLTPVGMLPDQKTQPIAVRDLQDVDQVKLSGWNSLFMGRSLFKMLGLVALGLTCVIAVAFMAVNLNDMIRRRDA